MPRFYFDIDDGSRVTRDDAGIEFDTRKSLCDGAVQVLAGIAVDELPNGSQRVFSAKVRDEEGRYVFHATLSLVCEWMGESEATGRLG